jgi:hypothetical protein
LDEAALAACMVYVDLNPIRAGMAETPEASDFTSIKTRSLRAQTASNPNHPKQQIKGLMQFAGNPREPMPVGLPFRLTDYLELADWTGRILRDDKRGSISAQLPPILERLHIDPKQWLVCANQFERHFKGLVGNADAVQTACEHLQRKRASGITHCRQVFG